MNRVLPLFALIVAASIFFFYVSSTWSGRIATTKATITLDDQALTAAAKYKEKENELATARSNIDKSNLDLLSTFLPDSVDNVGLILDINALAARSGLSLANINVMKNDSVGSTAKGAVSAGASSVGIASVARTNLLGSVDLSLSAIGTYTALKSFLIGLEKSARLIDVRDIAVKGSDTGVYTYQMTLRLYWLR